MKRNLFLSLAVGSVTVFGFSACQLSEDSGLDFAATESEVMATTATSGIEGDIEAVSQGSYSLGSCGEGDGRTLPSCATVTSSGNTFPKTITIDFGEGCTDSRGRTKAGQIIINLTDEFTTAGAERTVTFQNFSIGNRSIEGTRTAINQGQSGSGQWVIAKTANITVSGERGSITKAANHTVTWVSGFGAQDCGDKVFTISGEGTVTNGQGVSRSRSISAESPLTIDTSCEYPVSGVVTMAGVRHTRSIDFGDGSCDGAATVTRNGDTFEVDLAEARVNRRNK